MTWPVRLGRELTRGSAREEKPPVNVFSFFAPGIGDINRRSPGYRPGIPEAGISSRLGGRQPRSGAQRIEQAARWAVRAAGSRRSDNRHGRHSPSLSHHRRYRSVYGDAAGRQAWRPRRCKAGGRGHLPRFESAGPCAGRGRKSTFSGLAQRITRREPWPGGSGKWIQDLREPGWGGAAALRQGSWIEPDPWPYKAIVMRKIRST